MLKRQPRLQFANHLTTSVKFKSLAESEEYQAADTS